MPRISIESLDDPRVRPYRNLKGADVMKGGDWFVAEGNRVVERLLASRYETASVLLAEHRVEEWLPRIPAEVPAYVVPEALGAELVGFRFHVGVMACGRRPRPDTLDDLALALPADASAPVTLVVCPNCDNPENLGGILRIARAFGVHGVVLGPHCCDPLSRRVLRVSMGNALWLPIVQSRAWETDLQRLQNQFGMTLVATVLDADAIPLAQAQRPPRCAIVLGNEADGLDELTLRYCMQRWTIPMAGGTDSLNVAVAAAVFLNHVQQARVQQPTSLPRPPAC